jgi:hypothetical protein
MQLTNPVPDESQRLSFFTFSGSFAPATSLLRVWLNQPAQNMRPKTSTSATAIASHTRSCIMFEAKLSWRLVFAFFSSATPLVPGSRFRIERHAYPTLA